MSWGKSVGSQDVSLPHAATGRPGAVGVHVCMCSMSVWLCVCVCLCMHACCLALQLGVYILVLVSGVRALYLCCISYACLCMVFLCMHVVISYAWL